MIHLNLSHAEHEALLATLVTSHRKQIDVEIRDGDEKAISSLSAPANRVIGGAVQIDSHAPRVLDSLTIVDEHRKLRFEADNPAHGAAYGNRFISVKYKVFVPSTVTTWEGESLTGIGDWVPIPVFWGPVSHYSRQGVEVTINAQGKEALLKDPRVVHEGYTLHKGMDFAAAIKKVASNQGETRFDIPNLPGKLGRPRVVERGAEAWKVIAGNKNVHGFKKPKRIGTVKIPTQQGETVHVHTHQPANGLVDSIEGHRTAFYDGRGKLCVRKINRHPSYVFRWGRDFLSRPELDFDQDAIRNFVRVIGKKLKNGKRAEGHASLSATHPYSAHRLKWHDEPQYLEHTVTAEHLDTDKKCREHAEKILHRITQMATDFTFECFPIPLLEEDDQISVVTPELHHFQLPVRQLTIPLTADQTMSFGRHNRVKLRKRKGSGGVAPGGPGATGGNAHRRRRHHRKPGHGKPQHHNGGKHHGGKHHKPKHHHHHGGKHR